MWARYTNGVMEIQTRAYGPSEGQLLRPHLDAQTNQTEQERAHWVKPSPDGRYSQGSRD